MERGARRLIAIALLLSAAASSASAHNLGDRRRVVLSIGPEQLTLLVAYEVPAGRTAGQLRTMLDLNRNGAIDEGVEQLAQLSALVPRVSAGIDLTIEGETIRLQLDEVSFHDGAGGGPERGFLGMAVYVAPWPVDAPARARVALTLSEQVPRAGAEIQLEAGVTLVDALLPVATNAPVVGPAELQPGIEMWVVVAREV